MQLLGDMKLSHMKMQLHSSDAFPKTIDAKAFRNLPHHGWDKPAPVFQALHGSNGYFRFRFPPENKWMLGFALDRRIINCWETDFPPFISHRDEFVSNFVHEAFHEAPDLSGKFGTLVGAKLMTEALNAVPGEVLWEWLEHKEKKGQYDA